MGEIANTSKRLHIRLAPLGNFEVRGNSAFHMHTHTARKSPIWFAFGFFLYVSVRLNCRCNVGEEEINDLRRGNVIADAGENQVAIMLCLLHYLI